MEYKTIVVEEKDGVGRITLNKPPLNILDIAMMKEMNAALKSFQGARLKVLVLNANGKAFSAGVDVTDHTAEKVGEMIEVFHEIFSNMLNINSPIVALVNGAALGGGCEVATFCDIVIASEKSKVGQPEIMVGVFPPVAAAIFPRIIGHKKGLELLLTGATILAPEAKEVGLVNHVLPVENFEEEAEKLVSESLADKSAVVLQMTKRAFIEGANGTYGEAIKKIEDIYLNELMKTKDANEGLAAFLEKRKPVWKHE
jgi:cyclohexa-1,5-dienecarbonyl-CoA hydratase